MRLRLRTAFGLLLSSACLQACSGSLSDKSPTAASASDGGGLAAPVTLAPRRNAPQTIAMQVNQDDLTKAVERLRISKKKSESPYEQAGADLNSDGRAKALVLLTGQDWCSPQGCTLVIFEPSEVGYRPISQIVGVKAPVAVGTGANAGWRDLIVRSGANKIVRLQFTGGGYPTNAASQPDASADAAQSEVLIQAPGNLTAAATPPGSPPN